MLATVGDATFRDAMIPVPGKSEFGMDTLTRKMVGAVGIGGENLITFIQGLNQGDTFLFGEVLFYLQTWQSDDSTPVATVTLSYKGLKPGGTPLPDIQTDIVFTVGRITKSYLGFNGGKGITLRNEILWRYNYVATDRDGDGLVNLPPGETRDDEIVGLRPVYTVSATVEFNYHAVETKYRYIAEGRPGAPRFTEVDSDYEPFLEEVRITTSDGATYPKSNLPAFNITPEPRSRVIGFTSKNVIGSPYYEAEDTVRLELVDPDEFE